MVAQILAFWSHLEETDLPGTNICLPDSDCRGFKFGCGITVQGTSLLPLEAAFCLSRGREKSKPILRANIRATRNPAEAQRC